ncbi:MAG: heparan-alpha-glucosaminide N-acetyltransferase [Ahrensia sp.]
MTTTPVQRYHWLDVARGIALVAMAIYHFCWNLELFSYLEPGSAGSGGLKLFARTIASSFLILVGISLTLAHTNGIRWQAFWARWLKVAGAALIITIATYFATPGAYIYFGILHHIALASLLGLAFIRARWWVLALAALGVFALNTTVSLPAFDTRLLAWTGLYAVPPRSNDFVPLMPWFAAVLIGMMAGRVIQAKGSALGDINPKGSLRPLNVIGRHSLLFYLAHQPVLIAFVYLMSLVVPAPSQTGNVAAQVFSACITTCGQTNDGAFCARYCDCAVTAMTERQILTVTDENQSRIDDEMAIVTQQCARTAQEPPLQ